MERVRKLLRSEDPLIHHRLSYGGFIGRRYPYFYMETPKAACTTTKALLWRLEGLGPLPRLDKLHERPPGDPRPSPLSVPEDEAVAALQGGSTYRFFVWRDPVDRLRSAWYEKIHLRRDPAPQWDVWVDALRSELALKPDQDISFDLFVEYICGVPDEIRDPHFMSQRLLILSDHIDYHAVVRMDDYASGMAEVMTTIGVPNSQWPPLDERLNASDSGIAKVSSKTADRIRAAYRPAYTIVEAFQAARAVAGRSSRKAEK